MFSKILKQILTLTTLFIYIFSIGIYAQPMLNNNRCNYDVSNPAIANAEDNYNALDFECAILELEDFMLINKSDSLLLAEAYWMMSVVIFDSLVWIDFPDSVKKEQFINISKLVWKNDPNWTENYKISDPDYISWMEESKSVALAELDKEYLDKITEQQTLKDSTKIAEADSQAFTDKKLMDKGGKKDKSWYKKRWIQIAGGVILTGAIVALVSGSGGEDPITEDPLAGFPNPPEK